MAGPRSLRSLAPAALLALLATLTACRGRTPRPPSAADAGTRHVDPPRVPTGSLLAARASFTAALVFLHRPTAPEPALVALARSAGFRFAGDASAQGRTLNIHSQLDLPSPAIPAEEMELASRTLAPAVRPAAGASRWETWLLFEYDARDGGASLRAAQQLLADAAGRLDAVIFDSQTRQLFEAEAWRAQTFGPAPERVDVSRQVVIHLYPHEGSYRGVSLGMARFGLPDLMVAGLDGDATQAMGRLMYATLDALVATPLVDPAGVVQVPLEPGGDTRSVGVPLRFATPEPGDEDNRLLTIDPPGTPGSSLQSRQRALLTRAGQPTAQVQHVREGNAELQAASDRARTQIPRLRAMVRRGLDPSLRLQIKAPFRTTTGGTEFMWVFVSSWGAAGARGNLIDAPEYVPSLHAGDVVTIPEADVYDYVLNLPDGGVEGGETNAVVRRIQEE